VNFSFIISDRNVKEFWISNFINKPTKSDLNKNTLKFYDAHLFSINGKYHNEPGFLRLPVKFKKKLLQEVWGMSRLSSGLNIHFTTNSTSIFVKWKLGMNIKKVNMTRIGSGGVDLYCKKNGFWQFVNAAGPNADGESFKELISNMDTGFKEFLIYFPLFDEVTNFEIGILKTAIIKRNMPSQKGAIAFYGTSITQGSSASRPGLAYPSILSRALNIPVYNFGIAGHGKFNLEFANILCETNAKLFVLDCVPNATPELIRERALPLILKLHKQKPSIPILLMESITRENTYFERKDTMLNDGFKYIESQNQMLSLTFDEARRIGINNIYYLKGEGLIGYDHEGTIDGTHLTDIGFSRMAEKVKVKVQEIFKKEYPNSR